MLHYIDKSPISNKRVLLRVDYNVSFDSHGSIEDDYRITHTIPTIRLLLEQDNLLILLSYLGRPTAPDPRFSLAPVVKAFAKFVPGYEVHLIDSVEKLQGEQNLHSILMFENTRFFPGEKGNTGTFAKDLSRFGDVYVNDAFSVCHRPDASVVGLPALLPSYGGLLLKKEVGTLTEILVAQKRPFVVIIGGAKVSTKLGAIKALLAKADTVLVGGGLANTFLKAKGVDIQDSFYEDTMVDAAKEILTEAEANKRQLVLPVDFVWGNLQGSHNAILDIGPETRERFKSIIEQAQMVIWNGPVGLAEDARYRAGTEATLQAMAENQSAVTVMGGGDTISLLKGDPNLTKLTHISTGGGAMLEYIEKGSLPGIEVLKNSKF